MASAAQLAGLKPPWKPGQGGNHTIDNRGYKAVMKAARTCSLEAVQLLANCIRDPEAPWPSRIVAATTILDRAWGKPKEHLDLTGAEGLAITIVTGVPRPDIDANETNALTITATPEGET